MKKALLYGLSAVMLLSLTACGTAQANQPDEPSPTPTPSAVQTEPPQESAVPSDKPDNVVEPLSAVRELTKEELAKEFEAAYAAGEEYLTLLDDDVYDNEWDALNDVISVELEVINIEFDNRSDIKKPANLDEQYMNWRDEAHPGTTTQAPPKAEVKLFEDCDYEVVYAVDTVNIRASYSVNSDKLGSLSRGQSITRIGIGINDAEGWSKVQLSDGTIAYMVSSYLSTTKPATQTKPSGTTHKPPNTGTQTPGTPDNTIPQLPSSRPAGYDPNFNPDGDDSGFEKLDDPWEGQPEIDFGD